MLSDWKHDFDAQCRPPEVIAAGPRADQQQFPPQALR